MAVCLIKEHAMKTYDGMEGISTVNMETYPISNSKYPVALQGSKKNKSPPP
jgi:hypothetical protein